MEAKYPNEVTVTESVLNKSLEIQNQQSDTMGAKAEFIPIILKSGDKESDLQPDEFFIDVEKMGPVKKEKKVKKRMYRLIWSISEDEDSDTSMSKFVFRKMVLKSRMKLQQNVKDLRRSHSLKSPRAFKQL